MLVEDAENADFLVLGPVRDSRVTSLRIADGVAATTPAMQGRRCHWMPSFHADARVGGECIL